ncbi:hypothetical protein SAMN05428984_2865 [Sphingomonas sp. OK281]|nr:hypothetical protein SAMN05428984_2865 [Sphingomonas sp. OK281]
MRWLAAAVLVVALAVGGWFGYRTLTTPATPVAAVQQDLPGPDESGNSSIETIDTGAAAIANGGTPMAQRVAVLGLLNKRNGETREVTLRPGQATRIGDVVLRLRACEQTAPWEQEHLTGAFVQVLVRGVDSHWRRTFSGWLYKERPALNAVQHPVYDVWTKSCAMTFPATGPDTAPDAEALPAKRSSARKSPAAADTPAADTGLSAPSSDAPSNAT